MVDIINIISKQYLSNKAKLKQSYEEVYVFLNRIEKLNDLGFHLGTFKNLNLYFESSFIMYFSVLDATTVQFSGKPNGVIKKGSIDSSEHFFDYLDHRLSMMDLGSAILFDSISRRIKITKSPRSVMFFDVFFNLITDFRERGQLIELSKRFTDVVGENQSLLENFDSSNVALFEGVKKVLSLTKYERNREARKLCLDYWGYDCMVCGFNFERIYGEIGKSLIHVHHIIPLSEIKRSYQVDPVNDLVPVCPNCHAIIHRVSPPFTIEKAKKLLVN